MVGLILGGLVTFGVSTIGGEVYHGYHKDDEKNYLMAAGRKLADTTENANAKLAEVKQHNKVATDFNKATKVKNINVEQPQDAIDNIVNSLDAAIQEINNQANKDMIATEKQVFDSMIKTCDAIEKANKIDEEKIAELKDLKQKIQETSAKVEAEILTIKQGKVQIKTLLGKLKNFIELNNVKKLTEDEVEVVQDQIDPKFTTEKDPEEKIPDFTQPVEPLNKVSDIKDAANKKAATK